ncbi:MAG: hypothetical protein JW810_13565 [Sedimentisphaerales bacterium]|nr:hypothetical protein [Sedimentisphaerales bacterium]
MANETVCPTCGTVLARGTVICPGCGRRLSSARVIANDRSRDMPRLAFLRNLGTPAKVLLILAILAAPTLYILYAFSDFWKRAEQLHPHPTDPLEAIQTYFQGMQNEPTEGFPSCYQLARGPDKAAVIVGLQTRQGYAGYCQRIRDFLAEQIGEHFADTMVINEPYPYTVTFDDYITLTVDMAVSTGVEGKKHYGIREIREFPYDSAPKLDFSERNQIIEGLIDDAEPYVSPDDPHQAGTLDPALSPTQRMNRLIYAYQKESFLDTRHYLLEQILEEFGDQPTVWKFLQQQVADPNKEPAAHLRQIARNFLDALQAPK